MHEHYSYENQVVKKIPWLTDVYIPSRDDIAKTTSKSSLCVYHFEVALFKFTPTVLNFFSLISKTLRKTGGGIHSKLREYVVAAINFSSCTSKIQTQTAYYECY